MPEEYVIDHCSPTLAGLKTANMFPIRLEPGENITEEVKQLNRILGKKGIRTIILRRNAKNALLYLYRPDYLDRDLAVPAAKEILESKGYRCSSAGSCILQLIHRMAGGGEFPHEVGLFLGYPAEDVDGFIRNRARGFKRVGTWKVYGDEKAAQKRFDEFAACTRSCVKRFREGATLRELTGSRQAM